MRLPKETGKIVQLKRPTYGSRSIHLGFEGMFDEAHPLDDRKFTICGTYGRFEEFPATDATGCHPCLKRLAQILISEQLQADGLPVPSNLYGPIIRFDRAQDRPS